MSNATLPKEQMSAYMRWEMASFDEPAPGRRDDGPARPTIEELAAIREEARRNGQAEGRAEGYAQGLAQGREEGLAQAAAELAPLRAAALAFGDELARAEQSTAQQMLDLALDLAKAMLKTALPIRPELALPVVSEAIRYLPSVQQPALLYLHPADAALARDAIGDELAHGGWRIVEDAQLERGGCRAETASNQIDATVATRWQRIAATLARESDWLA